MFCTECGTENPDTNRFCKNCGRPLKKEHPVPPPAGPVPGAGAMHTAPTAPADAAAGAAATPTRAKDFGEFRSSLMSIDEFITTTKSVPLVKRAQKWWDLLTILGGIAGAVLWFIYGGLGEGFDWISTLLMIAIPIVLVWFRADIDLALLPLLPTRQKIPRLLLVGIGIASPFFTAWILYNIFHINQYTLMYTNLIIGTFVAYAITRNPQLPEKKHPHQKGAVSNVAMVVGALLLASLLVVPVLADDCASDPLNARDCLRTDGYAEAMAGLVATILSGLVNGPIIIQGLLQEGSKEEETEEGEEEEEEGDVTIRLTYPIGFSPRIFTVGWTLGASARVGDEDVSDRVKWGGDGSFSPDMGQSSRPTFDTPGPHQIVLSIATENGEVTKTFTVNTVDPVGRYARVGSIAKCPADAHGCPACPHPAQGPVISGSPTVMIRGSPAARVGDPGIHTACCGPNTFVIETGDPSVLIDGRPAARVGDQTKHCGGMGTITGW